MPKRIKIGNWLVGIMCDMQKSDGFEEAINTSVGGRPPGKIVIYHIVMVCCTKEGRL